MSERIEQAQEWLAEIKKASAKAKQALAAIAADGESVDDILRHDKGHDDWHASHGDPPCKSEADCAAMRAKYDDAEKGYVAKDWAKWDEERASSGARRDTVQGAPKGGGARVDKVKDGSGRTTYAVSCPSCGLRQMSGLTHEGAKAMADAHNAASHSNSSQG